MARHNVKAHSQSYKYQMTMSMNDRNIFSIHCESGRQLQKITMHNLVL